MADRMELDGNHPNHITASFYDAAGFAATVQIGHEDLTRLVAALDDHQQDTLIAAIEQTRAKKAVARFDPGPVISCPTCETRHPENRACKASDVRRADLRHDRMNAAARRKEMRQEMKDSLPSQHLFGRF